MQKCSICLHPNVQEINELLIKNTPLRNIAERCSASTTALHRHFHAGHIPASIAKAAEAKEIAKGDDLLQYVKGLLEKSVRILDQAEASGDWKNALSGIREARGCLELLGRVTNQLGPNSAVNVLVNNSVSLTTAKEWPIFIRIIEKYPAIRAELTEQLLLLEGK